MRAVVPLLLLAFVNGAAAEVDGRDLGAGVPPCDPERAHCLGIRLHVAITDAGPVAAADWIARQVAAANHHFAPLDVAFQITAVEPLPASAMRIANRRERDALGTRLGRSIVDVFVTARLDDIDLDGSEINGVTWRRGTRKFIIVSARAWERTLAHELGHLFGLPHSTYAISLMNKTERTEPPLEQRTFADPEVVKMRAALQRLLRTRVLVRLKPRV